MAFSPFQINAHFILFFPLLIALLAISDKNSTFLFFNLFFKMAAGGHFGWPKIIFDRISDQYATFFKYFFSKWPLGALGEHTIVVDQRVATFTKQQHVCQYSRVLGGSCPRVCPYPILFSSHRTSSRRLESRDIASCCHDASVPTPAVGGRRSPAVACWASDHWVAS